MNGIIITSSSSHKNLILCFSVGVASLVRGYVALGVDLHILQSGMELVQGLHQVETNKVNLVVALALGLSKGPAPAAVPAALRPDLHLCDL